MDNHRIQGWVAATALKLKTQAMAAADLSPEQRGELLEMVVERRSQELPPVQRQEAMQQLMQMLPGVEIHMSLSAHMEPGPFGAIPAAMRTASDLATDLANMWRKTPPEERSRSLSMLARAGISGSAQETAQSDGCLAELQPEDYDRTALKVDILRSMLGMEDADSASPLDLQKVFSVLKILVDLSLEADDIAATTGRLWADLCRSAGMDSRIGIGASSKVTAAALRNGLEKGEMSALDASVRGQREQKSAVRLLIALAMGIGQGGGKFAKELTRQLAPETIAEEVGKSGAVSPERCWKRFEYLSNQLTPSQIEYQLLHSIVSAAEHLFAAGPGKSPR